MKSAIVLGALSANVAAQLTAAMESQYYQVIAKNGVNVKTVAENNQRKATYEKCLQEKEAAQTKTFTVACENQFATQTPEEMKSRFGYIPKLKSWVSRMNESLHNVIDPYLDTPPVGTFETSDWRSYEGTSFVSPVKDQGSCGSCWAFTTIAILESAFKHKYNRGLIAKTDKWTANEDEFLIFSEQQLVSCNTIPYDCNGGNYDCLNYYTQDGAYLMLESVYPYADHGSVNYATSACANPGYSEAASTYLKPAVWGYTASTSHEDIKQAVRTYGPLGTAIDAGLASFQSYSTGIYDNGAEACVSLNHTVLIVGYGNEGGQDYWIIKNSWADTWGDQGYAKFSAGTTDSSGACDITKETPVYAYFATTEVAPEEPVVVVPAAVSDATIVTTNTIVVATALATALVSSTVAASTAAATAGASAGTITDF